jgi:sugar (pentulose or hexulose) kinase
LKVTHIFLESILKGVVADENGLIHCAAERRNQYLHPSPGWVEADPGQYLDNVIDLIRELASSAPGAISGIATAGASGNTILTAKDGQPVTNIINWMDQRSAQQQPALLGNLKVEEVRRIVGWPCVDSFPLAHLAWLRENRSDALDSADRIAMSTSWLLFKLTGNWVMDHSTGTTSHLQNQVTLNYHAPYLELLGLEQRRLPRLVPTGSIVGGIADAAAERTGIPQGTPVVAGCFDHPAAARAVGVLAPGQLMLSCGTSWVGFLPEPVRKRILDARLLCDPFLAQSEGSWAGMFSVPYIGRSIDSYVRHVIAPGRPDPYAVFNDAAARASSGASGICIDLQAPVQQVAGSPEDVSRAVMESAARLLRRKLDELVSHGWTFEDAVVVGGPSRSAVWTDIIAEMTGLRLSSGTATSGATGAAMIAGIGIGIFANELDALRNFRVQGKIPGS